jgi:hypothetical protein
MYDPSVVPDADGEWFELYNKGNEQVDLMGWTFTSSAPGESFTIETSTLLVPANT